MQTKLPNLTSHAVDVAEQVHTAGFFLLWLHAPARNPNNSICIQFLKHIHCPLTSVKSCQLNICDIQAVLLSACSFAGVCFQNLWNPNVIMLRVRCSNLPGEAGSPFCSLNLLGTPSYSAKPRGTTVRKRTKTLENMNSCPLIWNWSWFSKVS